MCGWDSSGDEGPYIDADEGGGGGGALEGLEDVKVSTERGTGAGFCGVTCGARYPRPVDWQRV